MFRIVLARRLPLALAALTVACGGHQRRPAPAVAPPEDPEGVAGGPRDETAFEFEPEPDIAATPVQLDGTPELAAGLDERLAPYLDVRQTRLVAVAPDGSSILVVTRTGQTAQIFAVDRPLAPPRRLTAEPDPIRQAAVLSWSPLVLVYRTDTRGDERYQIVRLDVATHRRTVLTDGKSRHGAFAIAPQGDRIAFTSNARRDADMDLYLGDLARRAPARRLLAGGGQWIASTFAPGGEALIVREYRSASDSSLHLFNLGSRNLVRIAPVARRSADVTARVAAGGAVYFTSDRRSDFVELHQWRPGAAEATSLTADVSWDVELLVTSQDRLAYTVNQDGESAVYLRELASGRAARLDELPRGVVSEIALADRSRSLFVSVATATEPRDVYSIDLASRKVVRWTQNEVPDRHLVTPERVRIPSFDGLEIPALLFRPTGPGPHPVLLWLHGGPESQIRPTFHPIIQYLVAESGIAVLAPNVRGSSGYGRRYLSLDDGRRRGDAVKDVGALLDWVGGEGGLDARRVGVYGASYGGFLSLSALTTYGDRLAAGCEAIGISDLVSFLEGTSVYRQEYRRAEYGDERVPEMREFLRSISPLGKAERIRSPLFVAHGANDPRVPVSEAEQVVEAARAQGGEVWYMLAPDEGHGFRRRRTRDIFYRHLVAFFERHLTPRQPPPPGPRPDA